MTANTVFLLRKPFTSNLVLDTLKLKKPLTYSKEPRNLHFETVLLVQSKAEQKQRENDIALEFNSHWCSLFIITLIARYTHVLFTFSLQASSLHQGNFKNF